MATLSQLQSIHLWRRYMHNVHCTCINYKDASINTRDCLGVLGQNYFMILHFSGLLRVYQICLSSPYMGRVKDWAWGKACWNGAPPFGRIACRYSEIQTHKYTNTNTQVHKYRARLELEEKRAEMASAIWSQYRIAVRFTKRFMPSLNLLPTDLNDDGGGKHQVDRSIQLKKSQKITFDLLDSNICEDYNLTRQEKYPMSIITRDGVWHAHC